MTPPTSTLSAVYAFTTQVDDATATMTFEASGWIGERDGDAGRERKTSVLRPAMTPEPTIAGRDRIRRDDRPPVETAVPMTVDGREEIRIRLRCPTTVAVIVAVIVGAGRTVVAPTEGTVVVPEDWASIAGTGMVAVAETGGMETTLVTATTGFGRPV
jgi:hypothetical protein